MNNPVLAFLVEIVTRLKSKSPKFFQVFQWIFGAATLITGLPEFFTWIGWTLPDFWIGLENKAVAIAGAILTLFAGLPVDKDAVVTKAQVKLIDGDTNKTVDQQVKDTLPFTEKN